METFHAIILFPLLFHVYRAAEICCYNPDLGCFTDDPPYDNMPLPQCMADMEPYDYTMYTRDNPDTGEAFNELTVPTIFVPTDRTIFITHGWNGDSDNNWLQTLKDSLLAEEDMNVVVIGWNGGANNIYYPQSASNTRTMGAYTAQHIDLLVNAGGTFMWCGGHSLGAHHCGHAGMETTTGLIDRVTGWDPAGPWFEGQDDMTVGLNPTSAQWVDVMHTDGGTLGTVRNIGHIDFYPAGGQDQPACTGLGESSCSHSIVNTYFRQSIADDCFLSRQTCTDYNNLPGSCTDCTCGGGHCASMGFWADTSCQQTGIHYLDVNDANPYCTG